MPRVLNLKTRLEHDVPEGHWSLRSSDYERVEAEKDSSATSESKSTSKSKPKAKAKAKSKPRDD